jgi:hypothetical protein
VISCANAFDASSDLPILVVDGYGGGKPADKEVYLRAAFMLEGRALSEADYQGIYWFSETIKNAKVRTNLKQLREDATTLPESQTRALAKLP